MPDGETAEQYRRRINDKIARDRTDWPGRESFLIRVSAELNALVRSECGRDDEVVYLVSETEDGRMCGERLVALTRSELGSGARSVVIEGLQVKDGPRFRKLGVRNLFEQIDRLRRGANNRRAEARSSSSWRRSRESANTALAAGANRAQSKASGIRGSRISVFDCSKMYDTGRSWNIP